MKATISVLLSRSAAFWVIVRLSAVSAWEGIEVFKANKL
jgi:hypothetical protein